MARAGSASTRRVAELLRSPQGLAQSIAALSMVDGVVMPSLDTGQIVEANAGTDALEQLTGFRYPAVNVYCEKISNTQREKFRSFSGTVKVAVDVRVTSDTLPGLTDQLHFYVEALTRLLDVSRGSWGLGLSYAGEYDVTYGPAKAGGKNYVQSAKVSMPIDVSA